jgi:hypothetical protein
MKHVIVTILFLSNFCFINAQESFKQKFSEASKLMEEKEYNVALPIWLQLQIEQPENANVNYKIGLCYIYSSNEKVKSLNYFVKATQEISKNYNPYSSDENKAPVESFFYLAQAYHVNYKLDSAIQNYTAFKSKIGKKHYLFKNIEHYIQQCFNAKEAIKNQKNVEINNLGSIINSKYSEYSPVISVDESTIYFTSKRLRPDSSNLYFLDPNNNKHYDDIYVSYNFDGAWSSPELIDISTQYHEATLNLSADGNTLFIYKDDEGDGNIYSSLFVNDMWSPLTKLGSNINLKSHESHVHISPDESTLYFVSDRKGGEGGSDIYKCNKLPNGEWALAQNIGSTINTPFDEDGIFIHPSGKIMYFSSKGHQGIGGFDIFSSNMDEQGNWTTPVNLGYPVNSTDDDVFFVTSTDGKRGYFSSLKEKGFGEHDIYMISMIDAKEIPLTLLNGFMKIIGSELPDDALITVKNDAIEKPFIYKPRKKDGKFSIILEPDNEYHIEYTAGKFMHKEDLYIPPASSFNEINRAIDLVDIIFVDTLKIQEKNNKHITDSTNTYYHILDSTNNYIQKLVIDSTNRYQFIIDSTNTYIHILDSTNTYKKNHEAFYQLFFSFDINKINILDYEYVKLIDILERQAKENGKVYLIIEGSASKAPNSSYGSNVKLAMNRSKEALKSVVKSLSIRGVEKDKIVVSDQISRVQGLDFDKNIDKNIYINYQYIIIKNGDKPKIPEKKY